MKESIVLLTSTLLLAGCSSLGTAPHRDVGPALAPTVEAEASPRVGNPASAESAELPAPVVPASLVPQGGDVDMNYADAQAGDWEITIGGSGRNDNDFDSGGFSLSGSVGYFLNERWEVLVRQDVGYSDFGGSDWSGSTRFAIDYHLLNGNFRPIIGANIGRVYGDTVDDTFAAAPEAGFKWYFRDHVFFSLLAEYQFFFDDGDDVNNNFDDGAFVYSVGLGARL